MERPASDARGLLPLPGAGEPQSPDVRPCAGLRSWRTGAASSDRPCHQRAADGLAIAPATTRANLAPRFSYFPLFIVHIIPARSLAIQAFSSSSIPTTFP